MPYLHARGQKLWYTDSEWGAVPLLFLHGFLMDGTMFDRQVDALEKHYRCITLDARCHGKTKESGDDFTLWDLADDVISVLDHLGIESAVVVGMSQGGMVAQRLALAHPERVRALVLISTEARDMTDADRQFRLDRDAAWVAEGPHDYAPAVAERVFGDPVLESEWTAKWMTWDTARLPQASCALSFRESLVDRLGEIRVPVLQIHGTDDTAIALKWAFQLRDGLADVTVVIVDGAHHSPNMTHSAQVNGSIHRFLQSKLRDVGEVPGHRPLGDGSASAACTKTGGVTGCG